MFYEKINNKRNVFGQKRHIRNIELSEEYKEATNKTATVVDAFLEKLSSEQQKLFHDAYEFIGDRSAVYAEDHFIEGFKFGLLMGIEIGESQLHNHN